MPTYCDIIEWLIAAYDKSAQQFGGDVKELSDLPAMLGSSDEKEIAKAMKAAKDLKAKVESSSDFESWGRLMAMKKMCDENP